MAFWLERALPVGVRGPVLFFAFCLFRSVRGFIFLLLREMRESGALPGLTLAGEFWNSGPGFWKLLKGREIEEKNICVRRLREGMRKFPQHAINPQTIFRHPQRHRRIIRALQFNMEQASVRRLAQQSGRITGVSGGQGRSRSCGLGVAYCWLQCGYGNGYLAKRDLRSWDDDSIAAFSLAFRHRRSLAEGTNRYRRAYVGSVQDERRKLFALDREPAFRRREA